MPTSTATSLPSDRPSRVVVEPVAPMVDGGSFPAKATVEEPVTVLADVFCDGHDRAAAALRVRFGRRGWREIPMHPLGNDRFAATFVPDQLGRWQYQVHGWLDHLGTWRHGMELKLAAGVDVSVDVLIGVGLIERAIERATPADVAALSELRERLLAGDTRALGRLPVDESPHGDGHIPDLADVEPEHDGVDLDALFWRTGVRDPVAELSRPVDVEVDVVRARFSSWYEFFPRSTLAPATGHGTLAGALDRLDYVASMGFDVLYLPPVHPIGLTQRKGRNNTTTPTADDVGSPWAIGAADGGHTAVAPRRSAPSTTSPSLRRACRDRGHRAGAGHRVPVHARPPVGHRASRVVRPPARRDDPVRREPAEEVPGHLPARLRRRRLAGACGWRWPTSSAFWIDNGRDGVPRRQPAHQGVRRSGSG